MTADPQKSRSGAPRGRSPTPDSAGSDGSGHRNLSSAATRRTPRPHRADLAFFDGAFAILRGARFLWATPASWPLAAVPVVVCSLLCALSIAGAIHYVPQLMAAGWPSLEARLGEFGAGLLRAIFVLLGAVLGVFVATFVTPPLSAPALERLVLLRERSLGLEPRPAAGFIREFWCALQAQLVALAIGVPVLAVLWLVTLLAPPAAVATVPLKFLVLALSVAWSLLDYPLSLRGVALRDRLSRMRAQAPRVLGFGAAMALLFAVPLLPLVLLPAAVAAAAEIGIELDRAR
jgi:CysZ protein